MLEADPTAVVVAAGGDGTVGAVAHHLADTSAVLGVLPVGTSNDFARSLGIPTHITRATGLLTAGKVATVALGRLTAPGRPPRYFAHAATVGFNVSFAELATRASLRRRLHRLTYATAAAIAARSTRDIDGVRGGPRAHRPCRSSSTRSARLVHARQGAERWDCSARCGRRGEVHTWQRS